LKPGEAGRPLDHIGLNFWRVPEGYPGNVPSRADRQRLIDLGGEFLQSDLAVLSFGNFVGRTDLAGVGIEVVSTKIGPGGVSLILEEVSALAAALVFGWRSPTGFEGAGTPPHREASGGTAHRAGHVESPTAPYSAAAPSGAPWHVRCLHSCRPGVSKNPPQESTDRGLANSSA